MVVSRTSGSVAFIGLGAMGQPMAAHLVANGFSVVGFDLSEAGRAQLVAAGGASAPTVEAALSGADIVITMLPNGKIVQETLISSGAWAGISPGGLVIDMSSSAPGDTRNLAGLLTEKGLRLVDAPVSGGVRKAVSASLTIMAGGEDADIDRALPLLTAMGKQIFRTGGVGTGHAMKAINNFVSGAGVLAAMEAVILGQSFGLKADDIVDILNSSTGKNNATDVKMKQFVLSETFGSGFALGLMAKDIRIAADLARQEGLDLTMLEETAQVWDEAQKGLGAAVDHTMIVKHLLATSRSQ